MNFSALASEGLSYEAYLEKYATPVQKERWDRVDSAIELTTEQKQLLESFTREMPVFVVSGAWCGDCADQCPILRHIALACDKIKLYFFDRDAHLELAESLSVCGGNRVPAVQFLSEDWFPCGRYGDRTLARYRDLATKLSGAACPVPTQAPEQSLLSCVIQEWVDQFERNQLILRTSGRLREKHGD